MSKVKENNVKDAEVTEVKDDKLDPKEAIETLRVQLQDHIKQADHHKTMAVKAQGALEVLLQLHPEEENSES
tara:strand:+ start:876 stop:1091 length:216 start_codon:yes stop_codon:yes gene_type:complete